MANGRVSDGTDGRGTGVAGLVGHVCPRFRLPGMRDTDNVRVFLEELDEFERYFESNNPAKRLPNYVVMSLGEDHTQGSRSNAPTPVAAVANNDWALGQLVDRVSHSPYWPRTAIFVIEDEAQDGPDHVDARRTVGLVISPYTRRGIVDNPLYDIVVFRTMELLLGSVHDSVRSRRPPMHASFADVLASAAAGTGSAIGRFRNGLRCRTGLKKQCSELRSIPTLASRISRNPQGICRNQARILLLFFGRHRRFHSTHPAGTAG
jgi:hypothetical protein